MPKHEVRLTTLYHRLNELGFGVNYSQFYNSSGAMRCIFHDGACSALSVKTGFVLPR